MVRFLTPTTFDADLAGEDLSQATMKGADFTAANLQGADLHGAELQAASFSSAIAVSDDFSNANMPKRLRWSCGFFSSQSSGADSCSMHTFTRPTSQQPNLTGSVIRGATLEGTFERGLTVGQLYSTASYQQHDLVDISLNMRRLRESTFQGRI